MVLDMSLAVEDRYDLLLIICIHLDYIPASRQVFKMSISKATSAT